MFIFHLHEFLVYLFYIYSLIILSILIKPSIPLYSFFIPFIAICSFFALKSCQYYQNLSTARILSVSTLYSISACSILIFINQTWNFLKKFTLFKLFLLASPLLYYWAVKSYECLFNCPPSRNFNSLKIPYYIVTITNFIIILYKFF